MFVFFFRKRKEESKKCIFPFAEGFANFSTDFHKRVARFQRPFGSLTELGSFNWDDFLLGFFTVCQSAGGLGRKTAGLTQPRCTYIALFQICGNSLE